MNFRQFAINNVVRNKRIYLAHFLSSTFSVMIFFIYALLLFHPDLKDGLKGSSQTVTVLANQGLMIAEIIIFIFSSCSCCIRWVHSSRQGRRNSAYS